MNEQLQAELLNLIQSVKEGAITAGQFLQSEVPDVVQQLLLWHGVHNFMIFVLWSIFSIITAYAWYRVVKHGLSDNCGEEIIGMGGLALFPTIVSLIVFVDNIIDLTWLKIWIAPKVWLLEYVTGMVK